MLYCLAVYSLHDEYVMQVWEYSSTLSTKRRTVSELLQDFPPLLWWQMAPKKKQKDNVTIRDVKIRLRLDCVTQPSPHVMAFLRYNPIPG